MPLRRNSESFRQEDREPNLETALKRMVAMLIRRITVYGEKWRRWFVKQQHQSDPKVIPDKHREYNVIARLDRV